MDDKIANASLHQRADLMAELERRNAEINEWQKLANGCIASDITLRVELGRLTRENWQLKGALGYEVPGDIPCGNFKCGLCEAKALDVEQYKDMFESAQQAHQETIRHFEKREKRRAKKAVAAAAIDAAETAV